MPMSPWSLSAIRCFPRSEDDRTIGESFLWMADELADTTLAQAMRLTALGWGWGWEV